LKEGIKSALLFGGIRIDKLFLDGQKGQLFAGPFFYGLGEGFIDEEAY
jgi:hypothetical protein